MSRQINEGLRKLDLEGLVHSKFEVDTFQSKMGEDQDVCVLAFQVKDRNPGRDLVEFLEKNHDFILDADVSAGENNEGEYSVFVEVVRSESLHEQIKDILYGIKKLTGICDWRFRYYKDPEYVTFSEESFQRIPTNRMMYNETLNVFQTESLKKFFNKTLMDSLELKGNDIVIKKPFGVEVKLQLVKEGEDLLESSEHVDQDSTAEVIWLTKVLGDYNIVKQDNGFVFTNQGRSLLLKRS